MTWSSGGAAPNADPMDFVEGFGVNEKTPLGSIISTEACYSVYDVFPRSAELTNLIPLAVF
jgi:hypothetical protein